MPGTSFGPAFSAVDDFSAFLDRLVGFGGSMIRVGYGKSTRFLDRVRVVESVLPLFLIGLVGTLIAVIS
jgi:hypothetical protein